MLIIKYSKNIEPQSEIKLRILSLDLKKLFLGHIRVTDGETDRETEKQRNRETEKQRNRRTERCSYIAA